MIFLFWFQLFGAACSFIAGDKIFAALNVALAVFWLTQTTAAAGEE